MTEAIEILGLSARARNSLYGGGIYFIEDLLTRRADELLHLPNLGPMTRDEIRDKVAARGLSLALDRRVSERRKPDRRNRRRRWVSGMTRRGAY